MSQQVIRRQFEQLTLPATGQYQESQALKGEFLKGIIYHALWVHQKQTEVQCATTHNEVLLKSKESFQQVQPTNIHQAFLKLKSELKPSSRG